jgi:dehydrogenase/reductase SDR family protein 4
MSALLEHKVAIVTGASRGIGEAIARAFVREGARVALCGRNHETLLEVSSTIEGRTLPVACHVGRSADIEALVRRTESELGPVDILVNNAATNIQQGHCLEVSDDQFDKMVDVNLKSAFRLVNHVAPGMAQRGSGSIINIASVAGLRPQFQSLLYSMTKSALIMMTRSWALELGPMGIRVNAIAPGLIQTRLSEFFWKDEARRESLFGHQPIRKLGQPSDIAEIAVLLASDRSSYVTGEVVVADGGFLLT